MNESVLVGRQDQIIAVPQEEWKRHLALVPQQNQKRLAFMSEDHHRVRNFLVRELPKVGRALEPGFISGALGISPERTAEILIDLERGLVFLIRNQEGAVSWAFPVTVEPTPHELSFDTGERIFAA